MKTINIAILGFGTIGSGVYELLEQNKEILSQKINKQIKIKRILDLRDFPQNPVQDIITHDFNDILNDDDIDVVVELMGGTEPAYSYSKACLQKGISVVTSNKEIVSLHGAELTCIANENNANYLFEASVGGGIPIIRPLQHALCSDNIIGICGILNGTTNFILTKMTKENASFDTVLQEAQALGYAERDPSADVMGYDAARKLAILLSVTSGYHADYKKIKTTGIQEINPTIINLTDKFNAQIKLTALADIKNNTASASVRPVAVKKEHPLYSVEYTYNAAMFIGEALGSTMFYGQGAGKLPTASAVISDIMDAIRHKSVHIHSLWSQERLQITEYCEAVYDYIVFCEGETGMNTINAEFNNPETYEYNKTYAFLVNNISETALSAKLDDLKMSGVAVVQKLRFLS